MYYVYILYSEKHDKYYIGQTNDVKARLERHNNGLENFTSKYIPWILVGFITKPTRAEAVVLEKKLKNLSRERLQIFIAKYCNRS
ncbi:MAG: GIY-YIG nuclease family protein [Chitinophagales bacterium]|jgi:putative endonuclease|nr:GIY-YIG nuclease family protein [Sphingobacteriales bacterium]